MILRGLDNITRFWAKTSIKGPNECWEWLGTMARKHPTHQYGFHYLYTPGQGRKGIRAHRYSYEITYGPFEKNLFVCHHCDNPPCVNPNHLFLGTPKDNMEDCAKKGRAKNKPALGIENGRAFLTEEIVKEIRATYKGHTREELKNFSKKYKIRREAWRHI